MNISNNIPAGWKKTTLEEVATIERGRFSPRPRNDPQYYGGNIPFVQTGDISKAKINIKNYSQTLNEKGLSVSKLFKKNTILMTIAANIGDVAILNFDSACPDSVVAFTPNNEIDNNWLFHALKSMKVTFESLATQNAQKNLSLEKIKPIEIYVPNLDIQKKISSCLSIWDLSIEKIEALIAAKKKQFEWLQKNLIKDDFKTCHSTLSDFASISKKEKILSADGENLLTVKLHCKGIEENTRDIKVVLSSKGRPYFKRFSGEFLVGRQNFHNGGFGIVPDELDGFISSNAITSLKIDQQKLIPEYLFFHFSRKNYYLRVGHIMDGTGQKELSDKKIIKLPISAPSIVKQKEVVLKLGSAKEEISLLKDLLSKYHLQKRGLMQKLLTGEWQVKVKPQATKGILKEAIA